MLANSLTPKTQFSQSIYAMFCKLRYDLQALQQKTDSAGRYERLIFPNTNTPKTTNESAQINHLSYRKKDTTKACNPDLDNEEACAPR